MAELLAEADRAIRIRTRDQARARVPRLKDQATYCTCCFNNKDSGKTQALRLAERFQVRRPPPATRQGLLGIQLIQHIDHLHPHSSWIELLPMRLGHDAHTDLAALALTESLDYHFGGRVAESHFNAAMLCYDKAVSHLRNAIETPTHDTFKDATLITVALLTVCELMISNHSTVRRRNVFIHWSGLKSVFLAKYQPSQVSDMGRAILYNLFDCSFGVACATGTRSQFDDGIWTQLEPATLHGMSTHAFVLRKLTNMLIIRTPRLIACVRSLREMTGSVNRDLLCETATLATELYRCQDEPAESAVLHRVRVAKTKDPSSRAVVPYSYTFLDIDDFNAAVLNWSMRQVILNLCLAVCHLMPADLCPFNMATIKTMKAEKQQLAMNLMMSWEFAETLGPFATLWVAKGLLQNWLQLRGTDKFKNVPTADVIAWALPKMNHQFNEWLAEDMKESDMDVAADLLVGGPLIGFIAQTGPQTP
ncbi:hypothetical protein M409DRAFT_53311 [Zasmidium cellare ATCC 36951]|uniref:Transcription factor domain-containing protein n=1 Tax=Zasmidium cellare ATCC 36951 TaxID=1080233 RepID=A0A6A6CT72_ZASCE|nr:uncharacterized protein M409DRAFT_53311 [Zasmidium cellare ATCC 36951]KAF2168676.1 hypothetical protein M409DRAFT_53311 [Zasmidium cellare ATCC 36951]